MFGKEIVVRVEGTEKSKKVIFAPGAGGGKEIMETHLTSLSSHF